MSHGIVGMLVCGLQGMEIVQTMNSDPGLAVGKQCSCSCLHIDDVYETKPVVNELDYIRQDRNKSIYNTT